MQSSGEGNFFFIQVMSLVTVSSCCLSGGVSPDPLIGDDPVLFLQEIKDHFCHLFYMILTIRSKINNKLTETF